MNMEPDRGSLQMENGVPGLPLSGFPVRWWVGVSSGFVWFQIAQPAPRLAGSMKLSCGSTRPAFFLGLQGHFVIFWRRSRKQLTKDHCYRVHLGRLRHYLCLRFKRVALSRWLLDCIQYFVQYWLVAAFLYPSRELLEGQGPSRNGSQRKRILDESDILR